ncbi:Crp/Fnr family transcriptional regulator [Actinomadura chibensis]|uniref:Crp/Fnr family transcriptional regulator n=1 Tax=Actinomadura chibensis TaxID=392828 RepID=A0A5D0NMG7_9ACTN|nr:Crp/Fnr family transcriptional regulator [Actinomadura chibensis]TYB45710.1 Crp/Fnr family transcriptional regulator [Actinomadura chibensis]
MTHTASPRSTGSEPQRPWPRGTLLAKLPPASRTRLMELGSQRVYEHGEVLLYEQERSTHVVLLLGGFAKVTSNLGDGRVALLGIRMAGDTVGEMAALDGSPRAATVTACGRLLVRTIPREEFIALLRDLPDVNINVSGVISRRLRWANRRRVDFYGYPTRVRLARILVDLAATYGHAADEGIVFDIELTQDELGAMAGADADTAGRELRKLKSDGLIGTGYRRTAILDLKALRAMARLADGGHAG